MTLRITRLDQKIFMTHNNIIIFPSSQINNNNYYYYAKLIIIIIISAGNMHTVPLPLMAGNYPFQEKLKIFFSMHLNYDSLI